MLRFHFVDNVQTALAADDLVIRTDLLHTCTYFHTDHCLLNCGNDTLLKFVIICPYSGLAIRNPTLRKIVRSQFYGHAVSGDDTDEVLPHFTGDVSYNSMAIFELDNKLSPWKRLNNRTC